jgi:hypothetical protein
VHCDEGSRCTIAVTGSGGTTIDCVYAAECRVTQATGSGGCTATCGRRCYLAAGCAATCADGAAPLTCDAGDAEAGVTCEGSCN